MRNTKLPPAQVSPNWLCALAVCITSVAFGQQAVTPPALPGGVRIPVRLVTTITPKDKVGRSIELWTTEAVKLPGAMGEIPKGAKLFGSVTESVAWNKAKRESRISLVVDRAKWKDHDVAMRAFIVGKLRVLTSAALREGGPILGIEVNTGYTAVPGTSATPEQNLAVDKSCKLTQASSPELGSEVVSNEHDVRMDTGSSFDILTVDN